jgi:superoxide dismutase, Cu-Zn family
VRRALSVLGVMIAALVTVVVLLTGAFAAAAQDAAANGNLVDNTGRTIGTVQLQQIPNGVATTIEVTGLPPGSHGIHFHAVGKCDAPDFTSAGGTFNPTKYPQGRHAGDLPDLQADTAGHAVYTYTSRTVTLSPGPISLFDADGAALVISADPGDDVAAVAGAGADGETRVACAVLALGAAPVVGEQARAVAQASPGAAATSTAAQPDPGGQTITRRTWLDHTPLACSVVMLVLLVDAAVVTRAIYNIRRERRAAEPGGLPPATP